MSSVGTVANLVFNEVAVMEDDSPTLRVVKKLLQGFGCRVRVARSQGSAVRMARRENVRSFLLDCHMGPGRSGEGMVALERIKKHDPDIFVGILTAYEKSYAEACNMRLADLVLKKSTDRDADIRSVLAAMLEHAKSQVGKAEESIQMISAGGMEFWDCQLGPVSDANYLAYMRYKADPEWMSKHLDMYVAFVDGRQVGVSSDEAALVSDVRAKYKMKTRFVTHVVPQEEEIDIPSDLTFVDN